MQPKPFILRYKLEGTPFAVLFLAADDFDVHALRRICKELGVSSAGTKANLIDQIAPFLGRWSEDTAIVILRNLIRRSKKWLTFRLGTVHHCPILRDPTNLVFTRGEPSWYGPIEDPDNTSVSWYFRLHFQTHWEVNGSPSELRQYQIRWICCARIANNVVSLH